MCCERTSINDVFLLINNMQNEVPQGSVLVAIILDLHALF